MWYWSVAILFWQLSIDHIVNGQCKRCGFAKTRLRHPSLPFDSLPYPTRTICRRVRTYVRMYARSVSHVTTKRKEVDHIPWVWGSVPRALRALGSPAIKISCEWNRQCMLHLMKFRIFSFLFSFVFALIFCSIWLGGNQKKKLCLDPFKSAIVCEII